MGYIQGATCNVIASDDIFDAKAERKEPGGLMMAKSQVIEKKRPKTVEETPAPVAVVDEGPVCQHHWVIASPRGAMSEGRCKRCGEEREFRNSTTDYVWDDDSDKEKGYTPWRGARSAPKHIDDDEMAAAGSSRDAAIV